MDFIIDIANKIFQPLIDLGAAPMMAIVLTLIALLFKVKPSRALEGGLKLGIAITGIGAIIDMLTSAFSGAMEDFVELTGLSLNITDVGWAPLATITWGSPYTLYFLLILVIVNVIMLIWKKTNTLDVDIFDVWHLAFVGLFSIWAGANLLIATVLVTFIGVLKIINADLMKPTFNDLLNAPESSVMTTTHMNYMMNPIIMVFDKIFDKLFPWLDKYDFDAAKLNNKIGFWGSKFAIGIYLGIFVGLLSGQSATEIFELSFTAAVSLELFSLIGQWFIDAIEPLSQGITDFTSKRLKGRTLNIGIDWPFLAGRAEIWAAANVLAPIMLLEAMILPGNALLPLGGIIAMGVTPALLVVTRGRIIRMIVIGAIELPIFLWAGTLAAPFVTNMAKNIGAFPEGVANSQLISQTTMEGPIEKFLGYLVGNASQGQVEFMIYAALALIAYLLIFMWYRREMRKRNAAYAAEKNSN
ncbi:PTS galactitol transporter subunit IIC [Tetragenococcus halophilus]|uniref:Putative phosphotransferase system enzyme IIC component n=1 Tax=Tetragenococcus halophilus subsp. halophilus TaxID=1513897 RepID=A0A2H6CRQ0_TETHA|nr:PTS transporter subunit IIC [Tetragenococcus halophilus]MCO8287702.1 PTS glucitol transporter subunit IIA [Tetragenococcus halophilus]MCO8294442.1 PTS glucitol transporter subunit IIA [Tetragenococcus halophilus]WJS82127.1 PTS glucitol transporter subunit IIA [Tetragenococcus halophilus]WJS82193.1 PTS glucitol transporter subunit IIA [Tetragenococcus halophilus]GBD67670.1 putative phosphotransferase system enzyme IIC component [Tetragenococcus halophilus subsp. halophilus]